MEINVSKARLQGFPGKDAAKSQLWNFSVFIFFGLKSELDRNWTVIWTLFFFLLFFILDLTEVSLTLHLLMCTCQVFILNKKKKLSVNRIVIKLHSLLSLSFNKGFACLFTVPFWWVFIKYFDDFMIAATLIKRNICVLNNALLSHLYIELN